MEALLGLLLGASPPLRLVGRLGRDELNGDVFIGGVYVLGFEHDPEAAAPELGLESPCVSDHVLGREGLEARADDSLRVAGERTIREFEKRERAVRDARIRAHPRRSSQAETLDTSDES